MQPVVTAIITVYNEEKHIAEAVYSLLDQTYSNLEVLVIDDGSSDKTPDILARIKDSRLRVIRKNRLRRARALKLACEEAKGKYIANLDADDYSYPERIAKQVAFFEANPDYAWIGCGEERVEPRRGEHINRLYPTDNATLRKQCTRCIPYSHSGVMFRKSLIDKGINYDPEQPYLIDFEFFLRIAKKYKVANLPEVLVRREVRNGSFFQGRFSTSQQNRRLARFGVQSVFWFKLPPWMLVYPLARLIYPMMPDTLKRLIRKKQGLAETNV